MKKTPKTFGEKTLVHEYTFFSPEKKSEEEALRALMLFEQSECPKCNGWIQIDCIIEQSPQSSTWHARAKYAQYQ